MLSGVSRVTMMFHLVKVNSTFTCEAKEPVLTVSFMFICFYAFNIALLSKFLLKIHSHIFSEYCEELEWSSAGNTIIAGEVAGGNVGLAGVVAGGCGEGGLGCRYIARQGRYTWASDLSFSGPFLCLYEQLYH